MADQEAGTVVTAIGSAGRRPVLLAGGLLSAAGLVDILAAILPAATDPYVVTTYSAMYHLDITSWAWLHGVMGAAAATAGLLVVADRRWTALVGVVVAGLSVALDLLFLPFEPYRAVLAAALAATTIRLIARHRWRCQIRRSD